MDWLRYIYNVSRQRAAEAAIELPDFETFWRQGYLELPPPQQPRVLLAGFRDDPEKYPLRTPSGKIEIFSETIAGFAYDDCPAHPVWLEPLEWLGSPKAKQYPLHLISNQPKTRLHSQLDNGSVSRAGKIRGREPMLINPQDAAARAIEDGAVVRVFNDRGACLAGVSVSDEVRPGVVALATGAWYDPLEPGVPGTLDKHGNANMLTPDKGTSKLAQAPIAHSTLVEVERFDDELRQVTVFAAPPVLNR
jgi:biotin/methionine sulfoxide reductase